MKVLSVVCARSGSKGLKNKCTLRIKDKMVVEYSIDYSLSLGNNVRTAVSTDIDRVISYCKRKNIDYIKRDPKLCTDDTKIDDVLIDAIERKGKDCVYCSLLYGNIPTRYPEIFYQGLRYLEKNKDYDAVMSMQNVGKFHPDWVFDYNENIIPERKETHFRRQALSQKMIHDGHTLIFRIEQFWKKFKGLVTYNKEYKYSVFGDKIKPLITDRIIVDIDSKKDLEIARALMERS
jgi:CMP-N-acetylneuraminic acid synthetase